MGVGFQDSSALESQSLSRVSSVNVMITVLRFKEAAEAFMPNPNDGQKHKAETQQVPYALRAPRPHSGLGSVDASTAHSCVQTLTTASYTCNSYVWHLDPPISH